MELLDKTIEKINEKSKVLIEILIYFFKIKISLTTSDLEEYFPIMKYIIDAIDGDETKIDYIIFPNITRIYASVFLQIFLELYLKAKYNNDQQVKIAGFQTLFQYRKQLWIYSQRLMIKILYYNILNENFDDLKTTLQKDNFNIYFNDLIKDNFNDDDIKEILNNKYDDE